MIPMAFVSTLLIKVKYGETLRRFNALVDENGKLFLDMAGLREKIISLFSLHPNTYFALRYVDEDGDLVTLVDDEDLHDMMRQRLKCVRIDVSMVDVGKSGWNGSMSSTEYSSSSSSSSSSSLLSDEVLKSIDLVSKVASSSPVIAELVDHFSKLGISMMKLVSQTSNGSEVIAKNWVSDSGTVNVKPTSETLASMKIYRTDSPSQYTRVECPFAGASGNSSHIPPLKRSSRRAPAMGAVIHIGIFCNGCGVYPITGPRFKSKLREDYDLCWFCYNDMDNETDDDTTMDPTVVYKHRRDFVRREEGGDAKKE